MELGGGPTDLRELEAAPAAQMLVVSANLQAGPARPPSPPQIRRFARRLRRLLPFAPDALLLQEVTDESAAVTAEMLSGQMPFSFSVERSPGSLTGTVAPQSEPGREQPDQAEQEVIANTAVVVNADTMRVRDPGGVISTHYDILDAQPGIPWRAKVHTYLVASKRGRRAKVALASIHFVGNWRLRPRSIGFCYKNQWGREVADFLQERYPSAEFLHVVGGDFNNRRCVETAETGDCEVWPFWESLVDRAGLKDSIFEIHGSSDDDLGRQGGKTKRIDYIFTNANVIDASHDIDYDAAPGKPGFYSDHALLWALLDMRRKRAPRSG